MARYKRSEAREWGREMLRQGLAASGLNPTEVPDEAFFIGRNPE